MATPQVTRSLPVPSTNGKLAQPATADTLAAAWLLGYSGATREAYTRDLRGWASFLDRCGVEALEARRAHAEAYVRELEAQGRSKATVARRLAALAGFYSYAVDEGLIERSPVARVRRPKLAGDSQALGLDRDELAALLRAAKESGPRDCALVTLLAFNGLRVSEALHAKVEDLGSERGHRTLALERKGGRRQLAALAPRTWEAIQAYLEERSEGPLFVTASGRRLDRFAVNKTLRRLAKAAGIDKRISAHTLRHAFVTQALDAGASLRDVQDAAGHADPRTTRRYDRSRHSLDRHVTYAVAAHVEGE